ncbi:MAG: type II toxin-antitoxin system HicA family toxin, partial [Oscillospiraceae bacterium]|nr:type II toxin-antitoxin system HicA family toxin [Oscillospiraceae bacterium]
MTERAIKQILRDAGWVIQAGGRHDLATHPQKPGIKIAIPRHRGDIPKGTAEAILKQAG